MSIRWKVGKKQVFLLIILTFASALSVALVAIHYYNQTRQSLCVIEIMENPSLWVNRTITVEGILGDLPQPSPSRYGLYPENLSLLNTGYNNAGMGSLLFVNWNSTMEGGPSTINEGVLAIIHGVIKEEIWVDPQNLIPDPKNPGSFITAPGIVAYYVQADTISIIGPLRQVP